MSLTVTVYGLPDVELGIPEEEFLNVDYVSLVSNETYGPPALVAPAPRSEAPRARPGQRVLYINTALVPLFEIERDREPA